MATMPNSQSHTLLAMQEAILKSRSEYDSVGISASLAGTECDRALWYTFRWASNDTITDAAKIGRFDAGNDAEVRLLDDLERIPGVTVVRADPETGKQFKIYLAGGHVRGKLDAECIGLPEAPKTWHVVECKSINDRGFKEALKKGLQAAKPKHYVQIQLYMHARGRERGLYLLRHRDSCATYVERVNYDPVFCLALLGRLSRIVEMNDAPSRVADSPDKFPCVMCQHSDVCFGNAFGRVNCRTCLNSTPAGIGGVDKNWNCEKLGWGLDLDAQQRGCRMHRYLPSLVPGEQIDADELRETVTYQLHATGAEWIDGGAQ